jgi:hypothetical protein
MYTATSCAYFHLIEFMKSYRSAYCGREFLDEERRNLTPSLDEKLIDDHFADWLEQKVITTEFSVNLTRQ